MEIDIILLGILAGGDFFGYELMKIIKTVMTDIAAVSTGTIYYKLKGFQKKGFLTSTREREGRRPPRLRYRLTESGRAELTRLGMKNLSSERRPYWPYLTSLFFVQHLPPAEAAGIIRSRTERLRRERQRLQAVSELLRRNRHPFHAELLAEHGMKHLEVDLKWLSKFAGRLELQAGDLSGFTYSREDWEMYMNDLAGGKGPGA